jgi:DNA-binding MarR family transcriptional regulator
MFLVAAQQFHWHAQEARACLAPGYRGLSMNSIADKRLVRTEQQSAEPPPPAPIELESFLPYRLNVLASSVSHALAAVYGAKFGISIPEWRVMATLGQFGEITAREIGLHSHMHKTTVSRAVAALAARGLIERRRNRDDMREAFLTMSGKGRLIYLEIVPLARDFADNLADGLEQSDRLLLDQLITRLMSRIASMAGATLPDAMD